MEISCWEFFIILNKKINHIGNILLRVDNYNLIVGMSILIGEKKYLKKGYGLKAWKLIINDLLANKKITRMGDFGSLFDGSSRLRHPLNFRHPNFRDTSLSNRNNNNNIRAHIKTILGYCV